MKKLLFLIPVIVFAILLFTGQSSNYNISNSSNSYSVGKEEPPLFLNRVGITKWYNEHNLVPPVYEPIVHPIVQFPGIGLFTNFTDVQVFNSTNLQSEISIGINPLNNNNHMLSFNELNSQPAFFSTNGGLSYTGSETDPNGITNAGDPVAFFNTSGQAYWATLRSFGVGPGGVGFAKTTNNGATWTTLGNPHPNGASSQDDKEHAACDLSGVFPNNVYCAWTDFNLNSGIDPPISFSRSTDGGVTWQTVINLQVGANFQHGANISSGPNGEVYVAWAHYTGSSLPETGIDFAKSTNGGQSFSAPITAFAISGIRTSNGGIAAYNNTRVNSFPKMDVDRSNGPRRGWIYITYPALNSGDADVFLRRSTDGGTTWSAAIRINNDAVGNGKQQWMPSVGVDKFSGAVVVGYHNMDTTVSMLTARYMAVSMDGGNTWDRGRVSDIKWTPAAFPSPYAGGYAGDYFETIAQGSSAWTTWDDNRLNSSIWQAYTSKITFNTSMPVSLKVYLEGFWNGATQVADTVRVYLANSTTPFAFVDSGKVVLSTAGTASLSFTNAPTGNYYIVVRHRNHIETWSNLPQSLSAGVTLNYDFTTAATQAFGSNMNLVGAVWTLIAGDINQDGTIDALDRSSCWNDKNLIGYFASDVNGDGTVDALDRSICWNNRNLTKSRP